MIEMAKKLKDTTGLNTKEKLKNTVTLYGRDSEGRLDLSPLANYITDKRKGFMDEDKQR